MNNNQMKMNQKNPAMDANQAENKTNSNAPANPTSTQNSLEIAELRFKLANFSNSNFGSFATR